MRNLLALAGLAALGYVGWAAYRQSGGTVVGTVSAITGSDTAAAWAAYIASEAYRMSPPAMRLTREQFDRIWLSLSESERRQLQRSYSMTQPQVAAEILRDPAFRNALMHAMERWRGMQVAQPLSAGAPLTPQSFQAPQVSGFGGYVRG